MNSLLQLCALSLFSAVLQAPVNRGGTHGRRNLKSLLAFSRRIDEVSRWFGLVATWLVLLAALVCALDALLRYGIGTLLVLGGDGASGESFTWLFELYKANSNSLRDLQLVMFAGMVMLGSAWTLKVNEHVRVDIAYTALSDRARIWIDLTGTVLFLMPFCILMIYFSWPWFMESWTGNELSQNAGGMPRWPLKIFVPFGFALIFLQGVSELIKCVAALTSNYRREHAYEKPVQ
jgi:TRAP-type mannitol/chloroaromatic compound transport system permease small subunit